MYFKKLKINGVEYPFACAIGGEAAPTTTTEGATNQPYFVVANGEVTAMYVCTSVSNGSYTWDEVELGGGGSGGSSSAVLYIVQTLTDEQKTQARNNIGAGTSSFSGSYNDLDDRPNIPAAYTLPQATASALGGIKADSVQSTDTQPVRIGTDGKLKTLKYKAGSGISISNDGTISLNVTNANGEAF